MGPGKRRLCLESSAPELGSIFGGDMGGERPPAQWPVQDPEQLGGRLVCLRDDAEEVGADVGIGGQLEEIQVPLTFDFELELCGGELLVLLSELLLGHAKLFEGSAELFHRLSDGIGPSQANPSIR